MFFTDLGQISCFKCFLFVAFKTAKCVQLTRLCWGKPSQCIIEVICNNNSSQVGCFQGPTHKATKRLPCCCLAAMPFPDVLLLDHVSINVNVFWLVKRAFRGDKLRQNQNLSDVFFFFSFIVRKIIP